MALAGIIATSTHVAITHPEAGSAETEVLTSSAAELFERQALMPRPRGDAQVPVVYVPAAPPSDAEAAFLVSASMAGSAPAPVAIVPAVRETTIESFLSLGGAASRVSPVDPVGGDGPPSADAGDASDDGAAAGEPF